MKLAQSLARQLVDRIEEWKMWRLCDEDFAGQFHFEGALRTMMSRALLEIPVEGQQQQVRLLARSVQQEIWI